MENASRVMVLVPVLYYHIRPNTLIHIIRLARGNTRHPRNYLLAGETPTNRAPARLNTHPGKHPPTAHLRGLYSRPGKHPLTAHAHSYTATQCGGHRASGASQIACFGNPLHDVLVFPDIHVSTIPRNPARAGIPLLVGGSNPTFRTLALDV